MSLLFRLRNVPVLGRVVPSLPSLLRRDLTDIGAVLDLGCGPRSPLKDIHVGGFTVGVEAFESYVLTAREHHTHDEIIFSKFSDLTFPTRSFDAVILLDVIEHMSEQDSREVIAKAETWARKLVVISSPNGYIPQRALDGNPLQQHLSGWKVEEMRQLGYSCRGLAGPKWLRQEVEDATMGNDLFVTIRFRPRWLWFLFAAILQPITYFLPRFAFSVYSVKRLA